MFLNSLSANFTKWSITLKQFVGKLPTNCLSVFDHFVGLALKGLIMISSYLEQLLIIITKLQINASQYFVICTKFILLCRRKAPPISYFVVHWKIHQMSLLSQNHGNAMSRKINRNVLRQKGKDERWFNGTKWYGT